MDELKLYRKDALRAAKDLFYTEEVKDKIKNAKTIAEIREAQVNARHKIGSRGTVYNR